MAGLGMEATHKNGRDVKSEQTSAGSANTVPISSARISSATGVSRFMSRRRRAPTAKNGSSATAVLSGTTPTVK